MIDDALDLQHLVKNEAWEHDQLVNGTTTTHCKGATIMSKKLD
jgi:hypothetical protein